MTSTTRTQRRYYHHLREMVCNCKSIDAAVRRGVLLRADIVGRDLKYQKTPQFEWRGGSH